MLCEECHKKRHGIIIDSEPAYDSTDTEKYRQQTNYSTRSGDSSSYERDPYIYPMESNKRFSNKRILFGVLILLGLFVGISKLINLVSDKEDESIRAPYQQVDDDKGKFLNLQPSRPLLKRILRKGGIIIPIKMPQRLG